MSVPVLTVASEAICKWGAQCRRFAPAKIYLMYPLTFLLCPTWGATTIVCYRLRDNWSGEVGRGVIQDAQLMLTTGSTRLAVSRGQQTWYHSTLCNSNYCAIVTLSLRHAVFTIFVFKKFHDLEMGSKVTQGHWEWYHSIDCVWFPISVL